MPHPPLKDVVAHWHRQIENFQTSSSEFYLAVQHAVALRKVAGLKTRRVIWSEGGALAPKREYLRLTDGRVHFDLCAAPFGSGYFFSWWLTREPARWVFLRLAVLFGVAELVRKGFGYASSFLFRVTNSGDLYKQVFAQWQWAEQWEAQRELRRALLLPSSWGGLGLWILTALVVLSLVALWARLGRPGFELAVLRLPVLGTLYQRIFAPQTYYRVDTAMMLKGTVQSAVQEVINGLLTQKGLRALTAEEQQPIFQGFA